MEITWGQHQLAGYARDSQRILQRIQSFGEHRPLTNRALDLLRTYAAIPAAEARNPQADYHIVQLAQILYAYIQTHGFWYEICTLWPQLRTIAKTLPDPNAYAQLTKQLAVVKNARGEIAEAQAFYEELLHSHVFGQLPADHQADVLQQAATCYYSQGDYLKAQQLANLCTAIHDPRHELISLPEQEETQKPDYALRVQVAAGPVWESQAYAYNQLGNIALAYGNFAKARGHYEQSLHLLVQHGEENNLACVAYQSLGRLLVMERRCAKAMPLLEKNLLIRTQRGEKGGRAFAAIYLAAAYLGQQRPAEAEPLLNEAMEACRDLQNPHGIALYHLYFGYLEYQHQYHSAALAQWQQTQRVAYSISAAAIELHVLAVLVKQLLKSGQLSQCKEMMTRLYANIRQQGLGPWQLADS
ncbi:MAG TPA: hypothetical protein PKE45_25270 [Caldilineaceae bacterium]|nr:hypothetical protein [Caldilineaceae bacterium]